MLTYSSFSHLASPFCVVSRPNTALSHGYGLARTNTHALNRTYTEISKSPVSKVPIELAKHEAAQARVTREMKRKRETEDQG